MAELGIEHKGNEEAGGVVTVSIGVASVVPHLGTVMPSTQELILAADEALYQAKRTGRNRVVPASRVPKAGEGAVPVPAAVAG